MQGVIAELPGCCGRGDGAAGGSCAWIATQHSIAASKADPANLRTITTATLTAAVYNRGAPFEVGLSDALPLVCSHSRP